MKSSALILVPIVPLGPGEPTETCNTAIALEAAAPTFYLQNTSESSTGSLHAAELILEIRCTRRIFNLAKPLLVVISKDQSGMWSHECMDLDIYATGESESESFADFAAGFAISWDGLADEPDEMLTMDAMELRDRLRSYVSDVEEVL